MLGLLAQLVRGYFFSPAASLMPNTVYDVDLKQITATVIVSFPSLDSKDPRLAIPGICVPGPGPGNPPANWTVIWTLVPGQNCSSATFQSTEGIKLPPDDMPGRVFKRGSSPDGSDKWTVKLENGAESANSFKYVMNIEAVKKLDSQPRFFSHDPTIAVVTDPIDG